MCWLRANKLYRLERMVCVWDDSVGGKAAEAAFVPCHPRTLANPERILISTIFFHMHGMPPSAMKEFRFFSLVLVSSTFFSGSTSCEVDAFGLSGIFSRNTLKIRELLQVLGSVKFMICVS